MNMLCNKCQLRFTTVLILTAQLIQFWPQLRRFCVTAGGNRCSPKVVDERRSGTFHSGLSSAGLYSAGGIEIQRFRKAVKPQPSQPAIACQMRWFDYSNSQIPETKVDIGKVGNWGPLTCRWIHEGFKSCNRNSSMVASFLQRIRARCGDAQAEPFGATNFTVSLRSDPLRAAHLFDIDFDFHQSANGVYSTQQNQSTLQLWWWNIHPCIGRNM